MDPDYKPDYEVHGLDDDTSTVEVDHRHVDSSEAHDALDPRVGQGTPATAPDAELPDDDHDEWADHDWVPSKKWFVALVTALGGLATTWATTDGWDEEETLFLITIVVARALAWLIPNNEESS